MADNKNDDILSQLSQDLSKDYVEIQEHVDQNYQETLASYMDVPEQIEFTSSRSVKRMGPILFVFMLAISFFGFSIDSIFMGGFFAVLAIAVAIKFYTIWDADKTVFMRITQEKLFLDGLLAEPINLLDIEELRFAETRRPKMRIELKNSVIDAPTVKNKSQGCNHVKVSRSSKKPIFITLTMDYGLALNGKTIFPEDILHIIQTQSRAAWAKQQLSPNNHN